MNYGKVLTPCKHKQQSSNRINTSLRKGILRWCKDCGKVIKYTVRPKEMTNGR